MPSNSLEARRGYGGLHPYEQACRRVAVAGRANPQLLMVRLLVESGFRDALRTLNGSPTPEALNAVTWLEGRTDWTRRSDVPPPPPELRRQHILSFEWSCSLLGLDPDYLREHGIDRISGLSHRFTASHLPGLREIRRRWAQAREQYEREQQASVALELASRA